MTRQWQVMTGVPHGRHSLVLARGFQLIKHKLWSMRQVACTRPMRLRLVLWEGIRQTGYPLAASAMPPKSCACQPSGMARELLYHSMIVLRKCQAFIYLFMCHSCCCQATA
jgi:hypothetical protein